MDDVSGNTWYHSNGSAGHRPNGGLGLSKYLSKTNEQFSLDLNLNNNEDKGKPVKAILSGNVVQINETWGWVLIQSPCNINWNEQDYTTCFHGYMHMQNIPNTIKVGTTITQGTQIGEVGNNPKKYKYAYHLHFDFLVVSPNRVDMIKKQHNGFLESVNVASVLGDPYTNLDLSPYEAVQYVDDQKSVGSNVFETIGSGFIQDNKYGYLDGMTYFKVSDETKSNMATYYFNDGVPSDGDYGLWAFIPKGHSNGTATYSVYIDDTLYTDDTGKSYYPLSQKPHNDTFAPVFGTTTATVCEVEDQTISNTIPLKMGEKIKVEVSVPDAAVGDEIALDALYFVRNNIDYCGDISK